MKDKRQRMAVAWPYGIPPDPHLYAYLAAAAASYPYGFAASSQLAAHSASLSHLAAQHEQQASAHASGLTSHPLPASHPHHLPPHPHLAASHLLKSRLSAVNPGASTAGGLPHGHSNVLLQSSAAASPPLPPHSLPSATSSTSSASSEAAAVTPVRMTPSDDRPQPIYSAFQIPSSAPGLSSPVSASELLKAEAAAAQQKSNLSQQQLFALGQQELMKSLSGSFHKQATRLFEPGSHYLHGEMLNPPPPFPAFPMGIPRHLPPLI